jgi:hypothetical protein
MRPDRTYRHHDSNKQATVLHSSKASNKTSPHQQQCTNPTNQNKEYRSKSSLQSRKSKGVTLSSPSDPRRLNCLLSRPMTDTIRSIERRTAFIRHCRAFKLSTCRFALKKSDFAVLSQAERGDSNLTQQHVATHGQQKKMCKMHSSLPFISMP